MRRISKLLPAVLLAAVPALSTSVPIGGISLDPYNFGATFDITNLTGQLSSTYPDMSAPVTTQLTFSDLLLTIDYQNGGVITEGESQFTDDGFGGFLGAFDVDASGIPIVSATLTGEDTPGVVELNSGTTVEIAGTFSATVSPSSGTTLAIGDAATIDVCQVPEPWYAGLLGVALAGLACVRTRKGARHVA